VHFKFSILILRVRIGVYKQAGEETGQVESAPFPCTKLNRYKKVCVPLYNKPAISAKFF